MIGLCWGAEAKEGSRAPLAQAQRSALVPTTVSQDILETVSSEMGRLFGLSHEERVDSLVDKGKAS